MCLLDFIHLGNQILCMCRPIHILYSYLVATGEYFFGLQQSERDTGYSSPFSSVVKIG